MPHVLWHRARKLVNIRLFDDDNGKPWEKSVADKNYEILCVSQVGNTYTHTHTHTLLLVSLSLLGEVASLTSNYPRLVGAGGDLAVDGRTWSPICQPSQQPGGVVNGGGGG